MEDAYGDGSTLGAGPHSVGYVLGAEHRIYHAGDTIVTDDLQAALQALRIDVALLPINGRDATRERRGIVSNMDAAEAVELTLAVGATRLVAYHWDASPGTRCRRAGRGRGRWAPSASSYRRATRRSGCSG
jgi:L-ascorbate metabolism protein UlaG (beta-lactamase superfamily)